MNPQIAEEYHKNLYKSIDWRNDLSFCGIKILKNPMDLWIIQEIIFEKKPAVIIETGTAYGGSAIFYATIMSMYMDDGLIISVDHSGNKYMSADADPPGHPGCEVVYLRSGSLSPNTTYAINNLIGSDWPIMVILDSNHEKDHVLQELKIYSPYVSPDQYLIVEDTNTDTVIDGFGPGPKAAVHEFLKSTDRFIIDKDREKKFGFSFNEDGYLIRVK